MTNPNTGKVPLTVYLPATKEGEEWVQTGEGNMGWPNKYQVHFELRPIVPATVMVEMLRDDAGWVESQCRPSDLGQAVSDRAVRVANTMRAALARKPCPVMVHRLDEVDKSLWGRCDSLGCPDRRPCKLEAGHGGEHE